MTQNQKPGKSTTRLDNFTKAIKNDWLQRRVQRHLRPVRTGKRPGGT